MTNIPIILLAIANDNTQEHRKLTNLEDEVESIINSLKDAEEGKLCEVITIRNTTIDDILSAFRNPKYKDRISVFHYAGHADGYKLLLETMDGKNEVARGEGLVSYFSRQDSLQLIFLNGCSTEKQAEEMIAAGVPAVIGTSKSIDDNVAKNLASQFYKSIGFGATLKTSWHDAIDKIKISHKKSDLRSLFFDDDHSLNDRYPWELKIREGAEQVNQWNLPDASNNPLFKLPKIDEKYYHSLPYPPFRYLKYYTQNDAATFYGRGYEIRDLYEALQQKQNAISLLYGKSGVGKSSLLNAGLIPRIEKQFCIIYARRDERLGLVKTLTIALGGNENDDLVYHWQQRKKQSDKPLLVILDQLEEYETKAIKEIEDELGDFFNQVHPLFKQSNPSNGQILLAYRKEYHVDIEKKLKERHLAYSPIYLEPLSRNGVIEAVQGMAKHETTKNYYQYSVEGLEDDSENDLAAIIADDLLEDKNSPIASLLQIHLSKLWNKINPKQGNPVHFTVADYQSIGKSNLDDFFQEQIALIESASPQVVKSGLTLEILQDHTTKFGTAKSCETSILENNYQHCADIKTLQQQLVDNYLLSKDSKKSTVLAHDTLGVIVLSNYANSDHPAQRTRRILNNKITNIEANETIDNVLDEHDLTEVETGLNSIRKLSETETQLLAQSKIAREQREKAKKRRKRLGISAVATIAGVAVVATTFYFKAEAETQRANLSREKAEGLVSKMVFNLRDKLQPIGQLDIMKDIQIWVADYYDTLGNKQSIAGIDGLKATNTLQLGETLIAQGKLEQAIAKYLQANIAFKKLSENNPSHADWERNLSVSHEKLGDIYTIQGRLDKALEAFKTTLNIREGLSKKSNGGTKWPRDIAVSHIKLGDIYSTRGDIDKALNSFLISFEIRKKLVADNPNSVIYQIDLAISYDRIGNIYLAKSKLNKALDAFLSTNIIQKKLSKQDTNNSDWQRNLAISYNKLGEVYSSQNKLDENLKMVVSAHDIYLKLNKRDSSNARWEHNLSISYERLGNIYSKQKKTDEALNSYLASQKIRLDLVKATPNNLEWKDNLSTSYIKLGEIYRIKNNIPEAIKKYKRSLEIQRSLVAADKSNITWKKGVSVPLIQIMRLYYMTEEYTTAIKYGEEAVEIWDFLQENGSLHGKDKVWPNRSKNLLNEVKQEWLKKLLGNQESNLPKKNTPLNK